MKIHILPKTGIQQSEKYAIDRIGRELPTEWQGYASLEIVEKGRLGRELDLVILLPDRVLIVELKRWNGAIKSEGGYWYLKRPGRESYERMETSPVKKNNDKAKILKGILDRNMAGTGSLLVDSRVVLCGNSPSPILTEEEKQYVLQLDEFIKIKDQGHLKRILPLPDAWKNNKWVINSPLKNAQKFDLLFRKSSYIKARDFSWQNYTIEGREIFRHRDNLYLEFKAINRDDVNAKALLRRWDFSRLGTAASTQNDWVNIAHRESRVYSFVKSKTDDLDGVLLQPIGSTAASDVTQDYCELFELPLKQKRLSDFIEAYRDKLTVADRLSLVKVLISKFSELHRLGVAHRDIGDHSIWLERPQSVRLSGFVAAYFPEMETVGPLKEQIASITTKLPEDFFEDKSASHFHRDVFLLGVISYLLIFGRKPVVDSELPKWESNPNDPLSIKLDAWFSKALSWDTKDRWKNASEMLDALNDIQLSDGESVVPLEAFDYFQSKTKVNQWEELAEPEEKDGAEIFLGSKDGIECQVKVWYGLKPDATKPDQNAALLRFLEKAKAIQFTPSEWLPKVIDIGLSNRGLLYAREWLRIPTLLEWMKSDPSLEERLHFCKSLLDGVDRLHAMKLPHGDLHPGNVLVRPADEGHKFPSAVFIDTPDFKSGTDNVATTAYAANNRDRISIEEADRYSISALISDVLSASKENGSTGDYPIPNVYLELQECLKAEPSILTLSPLFDELSKALLPEQPEPEFYELSVARLGAGLKEGKLTSDNGIYYIERQMHDSDQDRVTIFGPGYQIKLLIDLKSKTIKRADIDGLTHQLFQRKASKAEQLTGNIVLKIAAINDSPELINAIYQLPQFLDSKIIVESEYEINDEAIVVDEELGKQRTDVSTREIWELLIEAEKESLPELEITGSQRPHPARPDLILIPYRCSTNFDYASDEEVEVFQENQFGEPKKVATLEHRQTDNREIALKEMRFGLSTAVGSKLILQSKRDRSSYERRKEAIERILSRRSVIPELVDFFDKKTLPLERILRDELIDDDLSSYDIYKDGKRVFSLDEDKRAAFKKIYSTGPVGLLQGPPGTGKTSFIAAFMHYVVTKKGCKNILLVSQSHEATNNALEGLLSLSDYTGHPIDVVRVGEDGVLSPNIEHVGVSALQQSYRESFRSEFKSRITALSARLGLSHEFASDYCEIMRHVIGLQEDIDVITKKLDSLPLGDERSSVEARLNSRRDEFNAHIARSIGQKKPDDIAMSVAMVEEELIKRHGITNPAAVERLNLLIRISREWIDVLGSNSGNFSEFLARTRTVVAGTCVGVGRWDLGVSGNTYDWVVIDEAARATPSELAVSMQVGRRILLVGDHFQLPPFYKDELRMEASRRFNVPTDSDVFDSDFERAFESSYGQMAGATLQTQYRMAPGICSLVSQCFYEPRKRELKQGRGEVAEFYSLLPEFLSTDVTWVDTSGNGREALEKDAANPYKKESSNPFEAKVVLDVLRSIIQSEEFIEQFAANIHNGDQPIGVIAMYAAQVKEIERQLARAEWIGASRSLVKVDTVDSYQGKENKVVILSLVRNNPSRRQGFLKSANRLNVAMSRAMDRLVIIGASEMWESRNDSSPLTSVLTQIKSMSKVGKAQLVKAESLKA